MRPIWQMIEFAYDFLLKLLKRYALKYFDGDLFEDNTKLDKFLDTFNTGGDYNG